MQCVPESCEACALTTHPFLARLEREALRGLTLLHEKRAYVRGDVLFRQGEPADMAFCVSDAVVRLSTRSPTGRASVVGVVPGGGVVGLSSVLHPEGVHLCDAEITVAGAACGFSRAGLLALNDAHPQLGMVLCGEVAREVERGMRQAAILAEPRLEDRLAAFLLELAFPGRNGLPIVADGLTRSDLAGLCGVTREAVARCLSKMQDAGVVRTAGGPITILDEAALGGS